MIEYKHMESGLSDTLIFNALPTARLDIAKFLLQVIDKRNKHNKNTDCPYVG